LLLLEDFLDDFLDDFSADFLDDLTEDFFFYYDFTGVLVYLFFSVFLEIDFLLLLLF
jgi:hypothetical protein